MRAFARVFAGIAVLICAMNTGAQAPKGRVKEDAPKPPLTYHGLIPGLSTDAQVRETLGEPDHEAEWYAYKLLYPAKDRPGHRDEIHLSGQGGTFACCEAASVPEGYEDRARIESELGEPEFELLKPTFTLLDYSYKGLRFILDKEDKTIGVAYVPRVRRRVHSGERSLVDLRDLRQGPQPAPDSPARVEGLRAGVAETVISPVTSAWLNPAYRDVFHIHDDLKARCIVFEKEGLEVAVVGADLFGMSYSDIGPMIEAVKDLGCDQLILGMSHTHTAPDTIGVYGHYPAEYNHFIREQVVAAVKQARESLQPVKGLRAAAKELPMDGARVEGLIRNARNPGILDPTLSILEVWGEGEEPLATLINFACHPEGIDAEKEPGISADFPGYLCERVREEGGGQPVFLNGALGGMVSGDSPSRTLAETREMGHKFAAIVEELREIAQPPATFAYSLDTRRVEIPVTNDKLRPFFEQMRPLNEGRVITEMSLFTLGECQMVTLPGEVLPEIGFEIEEKMTGFPRMMIGLANDQLGYIIPAYDFREDSYEESMSQGPAAGPVVRDTAIRMLEGVR
jgi:hypothetical protein